MFKKMFMIFFSLWNYRNHQETVIRKQSVSDTEYVVSKIVNWEMITSPRNQYLLE